MEEEPAILPQKEVPAEKLCQMTSIKLKIDQTWFLENCLTQMFGSSNPEEYEGILKEMNEGLSQGLCAKKIKVGDVCWRCMDCEKDSTSIICKECFEKGDHSGHRVMLKRNSRGCCDCGDPEAWDQEHFCSDHKGQHDVDPEQMLLKIPEAIKEKTFEIFDEISENLKEKCMNL